MIFCESPSFESWSPDFSSSGLTNPTWTRVRCCEAELCNSLEWTDWGCNPVQVQICDACGTTGCASGGYVHVSALHDVVVWTAPRPSRPVIDADAGLPATVIDKFGSVAFASEVWESFRLTAPEVPSLHSLVRADGCALRDAWTQGQGRPTDVDQLVPLLRSQLLAADTLEKGAAICCVQEWLQWFAQRVGAQIKGRIATLKAAGAEVEKLYFDGPAASDWPALAHYRDGFVPALNESHIFIPEE